MRRYPLHINVALTVVLLAMCATVVRAGKREREVWYETATRAIETRIREAASTSVSGTTPPSGVARGVVLFVGDGMGMSTLTAARILAGQRHGNPGEETQLAWESFPAVALARIVRQPDVRVHSGWVMTAFVLMLGTGYTVLDGTRTSINHASTFEGIAALNVSH
ncbi:membrane-bound alkaline phosphatase-like [Mycetomoellerius zeteki]|uniref:membrane-bound alkaline phosphatase-like n=1 Tax=Mycetomoellerius zeteki TaxID=64791 RepID=UPI00084EAEC0|nr:PREDICTED: membrane-bound alkaline phosphatase-like [Trachymyrmex zeteki]